MPTTIRPDDLIHSVTWNDNKHIHITAIVDQAAVGGNTIEFLSIVASAAEVKAARAALNGKSPVPAVFSTRPGQQVGASEHGYRVLGHRLGMGVMHAMFVSRSPGFLVDNSDATLWRELRSPRYTTPLLRGWLPHVRKRLIEEEKLAALTCLRCDCWRLAASDADLDSIVESGLKDGHIKILEEIP